MVFKNEEYNYSDAEISNIFFLYTLHSNEEKTYYNFDFLHVFKYAKGHGIRQSLENTFYSYLEKNDTNVFKIIFKR